ncbi:MAG: hypothetical protein NC900_05820, partial [Candidatus Omnitrophica bacterium]|nr:hypothetical protein [Candidatus Omnitrophota bacterium]
NNPSKEFLKILERKDLDFILKIEIPLYHKPVEAKSKLAWYEIADKELNRYALGLSYKEIPNKDNERILRLCLFKKFTPKITLTLAVILLLGFSVSAYINISLVHANRALVKQLVDILQKSTLAKQQIEELIRDREAFQLKLQEKEIHIKNLEEEKKTILESQRKRAIAEEEANRKINELLSLIKHLEKEREKLKEKINSLRTQETQITEDLLLLDKKRSSLEKVNIEKMYRWIKVHQNPRTGLILSYEGDKELHNCSFLYDQALVAIAYTKFSDFERAKKIFDFFRFKAKKVDGGFLNAYYTNDGQPLEYTVHAGPNIWLGIAIAHYIKRTLDNTYLGLLKEIADWVIKLQNEDKEGGIRGGPRTEWYSTEHNLDAYALFEMVYQITKDSKYKEAYQKIINWLLLHVYDKPEVPVMRGKGDATIATDTYAWSIASLGPELLESLGMDPEKIIEFAEKNCSVEVEYSRPTGEKIKVKGFDFAPLRHLARGGVISCEWTAQMILAYKLMAKFYENKNLSLKAHYYEAKAQDYLSNLLKLLISSPSPAGLGEGCLPYASEDFVDTGHGWTTPKGKSTGSVSSTAYTLFAYYGFNPLKFAD